jgi:hypothetical protein
MEIWETLIDHYYFAAIEFFFAIKINCFKSFIVTIDYFLEQIQRFFSFKKKASFFFFTCRYISYNYIFNLLLSHTYTVGQKKPSNFILFKCHFLLYLYNHQGQKKLSYKKTLNCNKLLWKKFFFSKNKGSIFLSD